MVTRGSLYVRRIVAFMLVSSATVAQASADSALSAVATDSPAIRATPHGACDCVPGAGCPSSSKCTPKNVLWLPLGDSITWGCNGPTIQDCHADSGSYRVPLAFALTQHPLGSPDNVGFNISTMGTLTTGPPYVPAAWLKHEGHPGWQINTIDNILNRSLATSPVPPDLVTIHLGTNDCDAKVTPAAMVTRMNSLLGHLQAAAPHAQVFLADVISTGMRADMNQCIKDYNKLVPGVVSAWAAKGMKIYFVGVYEALSPGCGDTGDYKNLCGGHQIHPTSAGYPRMASAFALSILENFKAA